MNCRISIGICSTSLIGNPFSISSYIKLVQIQKGFSPSVRMDRMESSGIGRPPTGMIHPAVVNRPITQQGLRAPTRAGTASG